MTLLYLFRLIVGFIIGALFCVGIYVAVGGVKVGVIVVIWSHPCCLKRGFWLIVWFWGFDVCVSFGAVLYLLVYFWCRFN